MFDVQAGRILFAATGVVAAAELVGGDGPKLRRVCRDLWNCVRLFR